MAIGFAPRGLARWQSIQRLPEVPFSMVSAHVPYSTPNSTASPGKCAPHWSSRRCAVTFGQSALRRRSSWGNGIEGPYSFSNCVVFNRRRHSQQEQPTSSTSVRRATSHNQMLPLMACGGAGLAVGEGRGRRAVPTPSRHGEPAGALIIGHPSAEARIKTTLTGSGSGARAGSTCHPAARWRSAAS